MNKPPQPSDEDRAELVAYLDGELSGEAARTLEARLNVEPALRAEANALRRTWEILDYLPQADPKPRFTERTLSRVMPPPSGGHPAAPPAARGAPKWLLYPVIAFSWAAALLLALALGYRGFGALAPPEPGEGELVRDLRLIENKRAYDGVEDFDFLRQLDHPDLFGEEAGGP
jgi:anti-sigma factor RsiW